MLLFVSCKYFVKKEDPKVNKADIVAEIYDKKLYKSDLKGLISSATSTQDSIAITNQFIKNWINKQLLLQIAEANIAVEELEIDKKVNDYRFQLIVYEYKKNYIYEKLNRDVSEQEILEYYNANKEDFELKENIIRCNYLKLPLNAPKLDKAILWFKSPKESNKNKIKEYAYENSLKYSFEDSAWVKFNDVIEGTELKKITDKTSFIERNKYIQTQDSNFIYLFEIVDYKLLNNTSPIEFVHDIIQNIIINKRKTIIIKQLEQDIYNNADKNKLFKIY